MDRMMKNIIKLIAVLFLTLGSYTVSAQPPDPPDNGNGSGGSQSDKLDGGGAPIGGGLFVLLGLSAAYGGRKIYHLKTIDTPN